MGNVAKMAEVCPPHNYFEGVQGSQENAVAAWGSTTVSKVAWFALVIHQFKREQCELALARLGYEYFSPCVGVMRQWSDRRKLLQVPLFPGYIFCRLNPEKKLPVLQIPGVLSIVGSSRHYLEVDSKEIEAIRVAIASRLPLESVDLGIVPGQKVKVTRGPLCGLEGRLMRAKAQARLLLSVSMLNRCVSVEVEASQLTLQN